MESSGKGEPLDTKQPKEAAPDTKEPLDTKQPKEAAPDTKEPLAPGAPIPNDDPLVDDPGIFLGDYFLLENLAVVDSWILDEDYAENDDDVAESSSQGKGETILDQSSRKDQGVQKGKDNGLLDKNAKKDDESKRGRNNRKAAERSGVGKSPLTVVCPDLTYTRKRRRSRTRHGSVHREKSLEMQTTVRGESGGGPDRKRNEDVMEGILRNERDKAGVGGGNDPKADKKPGKGEDPWDGKTEPRHHSETGKGGGATGISRGQRTSDRKGTSRAEEVAARRNRNFNDNFRETRKLRDMEMDRKRSPGQRQSNRRSSSIGRRQVYYRAKRSLSIGRSNLSLRERKSSSIGKIHAPSEKRTFPSTGRRRLSSRDRRSLSRGRRSLSRGRRFPVSRERRSLSRGRRSLSRERRSLSRGRRFPVSRERRSVSRGRKFPVSRERRSLSRGRRSSSVGRRHFSRDRRSSSAGRKRGASRERMFDRRETPRKGSFSFDERRDGGEANPSLQRSVRSVEKEGVGEVSLEQEDCGPKWSVEHQKGVQDKGSRSMDISPMSSVSSERELGVFVCPARSGVGNKRGRQMHRRGNLSPVSSVGSRSLSSISLANSNDYEELRRKRKRLPFVSERSGLLFVLHKSRRVLPTQGYPQGASVRLPTKGRYQGASYPAAQPRPYPPGYLPRPYPPGYLPRPYPPGYLPRPYPPGYLPRPYPPGYLPRPYPPGYLPRANPNSDYPHGEPPPPGVMDLPPKPGQLIHVPQVQVMPHSAPAALMRWERHKVNVIVGHVGPARSIDDVAPDRVGSDRCIVNVPLGHVGPARCIVNVAPDHVGSDRCIVNVPLEHVGPDRCIVNVPLGHVGPARSIVNVAPDRVGSDRCIVNVPLEHVGPADGKKRPLHPPPPPVISTSQNGANDCSPSNI